MSISTQTQQTMLSTEIVKIINDMREEGAAVLTHDNFMKKVVKVLGEKDAVKFYAIYKDSMNREKPCYALPKREANLMVMSENYKVQAAVYDRMVELEQKAAQPVMPMNYIEALEHLMAARIKSDPLMTMQNLIIIHGRPTWSSQFLIATFNTCGRFSSLRYEFLAIKPKMIMVAAPPPLNYRLAKNWLAPM